MCAHKYDIPHNSRIAFISHEQKIQQTLSQFCWWSKMQKGAFKLKECEIPWLSTDDTILEKFFLMMPQCLDTLLMLLQDAQNLVWWIDDFVSWKKTNKIDVHVIHAQTHTHRHTQTHRQDTYRTTTNVCTACLLTHWCMFTITHCTFT